ncbi:MAG: VOC family protein [Chloroflexi bacterium]|nr:VOC family protein [Chloroflexota bacterium]
MRSAKGAAQGQSCSSPHQDKALDFYVNKLGFEKREDVPMDDQGNRWIEVAPPGGETRVVLVRGYGDWTPEKVGQFNSNTFETDDIQKTYEALKGRGVEFTQEPKQEFWGTYAMFLDQDGNSFVLTQR